MKQLEGREAGLGEVAAAERNQLQVRRWERSPWVGFVRGSFMGGFLSDRYWWSLARKKEKRQECVES